MLRKYPCYFLHGYPSVLSEFAHYCEHDSELLKLLRGKLKGAFLSSEYPYPVYRKKLEQVFGIKTQSFYGHTERCVMAFETEEQFRFKPFQTYGYAETIKDNNDKNHLVGTSYFNMASPLIRYDTEDIIDNPCYEDGILELFDIKEGRSGQFIEDKNGKKVSLTGLVMGRHHGLFNLCEHIQVHQDEPGHATIIYVPKIGQKIERPETLFDASNVDVDFCFLERNQPIRTASGKINLLVKR